ncbi:ribosome silencing factor [Chlamydia crocodili]|uniref:Ribosomal silencing factor RsfS n=1 Tax=Chlamydia crocodili TaxID=2766982 RepID=A0ABX8CG67_9CHLA|nr:ribosome silencing factor [Chlamydia crocodili]QVE49591.1 ribosome silencing factor [Chlamydia crocodili]
MELFCFNLLKVIAKVIDNKKGNNPVVLDVRAISQLTDYFIFAEGNVGVHVKALAETIVQELKEYNLTPLHVEGLSHGDWVVIDYGFIVIHLFVSSIREQYRLEELWKDGSIITSKLLAS